MSQGLKTDAFCGAADMPGHVRPIPALLHPEVTDQCYRCGSPLPPAARDEPAGSRC